MSDDGSSQSGSGKPPSSGSDVVLIHGVTEDGKGLNVLRAREERLEIGQVRPLEEGKPIAGDVVRLKPRAETPFICDVETQVRLSAPAAPSQRSEPQSSEPQSSELRATESRPATPQQEPGSGQQPALSRRKGPPQVASEAYRKNWDVIWNTSSKKPTVLN